jgi:CBS domain-containing protein
MDVREGMTEVVLTVGPGHTLREAAAAMVRRHVGAAVVIDPDAQGPGVITERDILISVGSGQDPDSEHVADHLTSKLTFASPGWSLEEAAAAMVRGRFRHMIVVDGSELVGILSMRDIVNAWTTDGATSEVPAVSVEGSATG